MIKEQTRTVIDHVMVCDKCNKKHKITNSLQEAIEEAVHKKEWYIAEQRDGSIRSLCNECHENLIENWYNQNKPFILEPDNTDTSMPDDMPF